MTEQREAAPVANRERVAEALRDRLRASNFNANIHEPLRTQGIYEWAALLRDALFSSGVLRDEAEVKAEVSEEIATALETVPGEVYPEDFFPPDGTSVDCHSARVMRVAYPAAAHIAREIGGVQ